MQFELRQPFPCPPHLLFDLLEGEELEHLVQTSSSSERIPLEARWDGPVFIRRTRIRPRRQLPQVVARMLGPEGLSYEHIVHTQRNVGENRWWLEIARVGERVSIGGTERLVDGPDGSLILSQTRIEVRAPLIASRVERAVRQEIERTMGRREELILRMLRG